MAKRLQLGLRGLISVCGIVLILVATPRLVGALLRMPGNEATELSATGNDLAIGSYRRAIGSRDWSLAWYSDRRTLVELGILYFNRARQAPAGSSEQHALFSRSLLTLHQSLALSPAQPIAWLLTARAHAELGSTLATARALTWTVHTGQYLEIQIRPRTILGLRVWDLLDEATRVALMPSIRDTVHRDANLAAWAAVAAGVEEDLEDRLRRLEPDTFELAERFMNAVDEHRQRLALAAAASQEPIDMRRLFAASAFVLALDLPAAVGAMTIEQYHVATRDATTVDASVDIDSYLGGVLDGLVMLSELAGAKDAVPFCLPPQDVRELDVAIFRADLDAMLVDLRAELPDFATIARTRSVGLAAIQLLAMRHPCDE